jgi:hypothetical protein
MAVSIVQELSAYGHQSGQFTFRNWSLSLKEEIQITRESSVTGGGGEEKAAEA